MILRPRLAALLLLAATRSSTGQVVDEEILRDRPIRTTVNVVLVPTTVTRNDRQVGDLKPHEFKLYDNNKLQDIRVDVSFQPISLVVAIQANAATVDVLPKVAKIASLLDTLIAGEGGQVAILCFDHRIQVLTDFTDNSDKIKAAMTRLRPGSSSNRIIDASIHAVRMLRRRPPDHRRVLLLISDTRDISSEAKMRYALEDVQFENVSVYTVNINRLISTLTQRPAAPRPDPVPPSARPLPAGAARTPENVAAYSGYGSDATPLFVEIWRDIKGVFVSNAAEVLTKYTGGKEYSFVRQEALEQAIADIGEEIHSQYLISYNPNKEVRLEGGLHKIRVDVDRPGLKVRTRPGYWMAGIPE